MPLNIYFIFNGGMKSLCSLLIIFLINLRKCELFIQRNSNICIYLSKNLTNSTLLLSSFHLFYIQYLYISLFFSVIFLAFCLFFYLFILLFFCFWLILNVLCIDMIGNVHGFDVKYSGQILINSM